MDCLLPQVAGEARDARLEGDGGENRGEKMGEMGETDESNPGVFGPLLRGRQGDVSRKGNHIIWKSVWARENDWLH